MIRVISCGIILKGVEYYGKTAKPKNDSEIKGFFYLGKSIKMRKIFKDRFLKVDCKTYWLCFAGKARYWCEMLMQELNPSYFLEY